MWSPNSYTKEEMNAYLRDRYRAKRKWAMALVGSECVKCGSTRNLQFDHKDPTSKSFNISSFLRSKTEEEIVVELKKCQILCRDCHKEKSKQETHYQKARGEQISTSKLTESQVKQIKDYLATNKFGTMELSRMFGVHKGTIIAIKNGKTWKHVI